MMLLASPRPLRVTFTAALLCCICFNNGAVLAWQSTITPCAFSRRISVVNLYRPLDTLEGLANATESITFLNGNTIPNKLDDPLSSQIDNADEGHPSGNLGDIMSPSESLLFRDGLVTDNSAHSLSKTYGILDPLDRMAMTANGNLQRLFSSYYDAPVYVVVEYCRPRLLAEGSGSAKVWDRQVHLAVHNQTFCTATSTIWVHDRECQDLVESGSVGLGQLYRYLDILPEFELHQAAPTPEGGCCRNYTLASKYVTCQIQEIFVQGAWKIQP
jgi:hypothetical protein